MGEDQDGINIVLIAAALFILLLFGGLVIMLVRLAQRKAHKARTKSDRADIKQQ
jgi:ABC-type nitrate/sulfonate/bicarbonate transport system permease component